MSGVLKGSETTMATMPVRLGLIGCGNISPLHVRSIAAVPGAVITALADINAGTIAGLKEQFPHLAEVPAFTDYRALLETEIDGALILTPHGLHYQQITDALAAGKHVLTEKPFVTHPE